MVCERFLVRGRCIRTLHTRRGVKDRVKKKRGVKAVKSSSIHLSLGVGTSPTSKFGV